MTGLSDRCGFLSPVFLRVLGALFAHCLKLVKDYFFFKKKDIFFFSLFFILSFFDGFLRFGSRSECCFWTCLSFSHSLLPSFPSFGLYYFPPVEVFFQCGQNGFPICMAPVVHSFSILLWKRSLRPCKTHTVLPLIWYFWSNFFCTWFFFAAKSRRLNLQNFLLKRKKRKNPTAIKPNLYTFRLIDQKSFSWKSSRPRGLARGTRRLVLSYVSQPLHILGNVRRWKVIAYTEAPALLCLTSCSVTFRTSNEEEKKEKMSAERDRKRERGFNQSSNIFSSLVSYFLSYF